MSPSPQTQASSRPLSRFLLLACAHWQASSSTCTHEERAQRWERSQQCKRNTTQDTTQHEHCKRQESTNAWVASCTHSACVARSRASSSLSQRFRSLEACTTHHRTIADVRQEAKGCGRRNESPHAGGIRTRSVNQVTRCQNPLATCGTALQWSGIRLTCKSFVNPHAGTSPG